jgi:hypothetical protein
MLMMDIWKMRMLMCNSVMPVQMGVWLFHYFMSFMLVLVMFIMAVKMFVLEGFVGVHMIVNFR